MTGTNLPTPGKKMPSQREDLAYGKQKEREVQSSISAFLGEPMLIQPDLSVWDFDGTTKRGELKSRRYSYADMLRMGTVWIGHNKIEAFNRTDKKCYAFFNFTDGLYALEYDPWTWESFGTRVFQRTDRSDANDREQLLIDVPTHLLVPVPLQ